MEDAWGNAVYFIVSGWVKVRRISGDDSVALTILGRGDFFGASPKLTNPLLSSGSETGSYFNHLRRKLWTTIHQR